MLGPELTLVDDNHVLWEGRKLLYFGGTDYHRLSRHPRVREAVRHAAGQYGISPTGSRITTGNHPLYRELETEIAKFFATEAALVCSGGYLANMVLIQSVSREFDRVFIDQRAHPALWDAARVSGLPLVVFRHGDVDHLAAQLQQHLSAHEHPLILTDGIFPAEGEMAPLGQLADLARRFSGKLLIDDAHGMGVLGTTGKGSVEEAQLPADIYYQTGTLSKAFGTFGGILTGPAGLIRQVQHQSAAFIGSTGLPLPIAAASVQALRILREEPGLLTDLRQNTFYLRKQLQQLGWSIPASPVPVISLRFTEEAQNRRLRTLLLEREIFPPFIHYPGAPAGGHFRFVISSRHTREELNRVVEALSRM